MNLLAATRFDKVTGTFLYRNGPDYRNGLPEWALTCVLEYFFNLVFSTDLPRMYTDNN